MNKIVYFDKNRNHFAVFETHMSGGGFFKNLHKLGRELEVPKEIIALLNDEEQDELLALLEFGQDELAERFFLLANKLENNRFSFKHFKLDTNATLIAKNKNHFLFKDDNSRFVLTDKSIFN